MTDDPAETGQGVLSLNIGPGLPGDGTLKLRIARAYAAELRECVQAEGLDIALAGEFSAGDAIDVFAVGVGSGGALTTALATGISAFFKRHKDKKIEFYAEGGVKSISGGCSLDEVRAIVEIGEQQRLGREQQKAEVEANLASRGHPRKQTGDKKNKKATRH